MPPTSQSVENSFSLSRTSSSFTGTSLKFFYSSLPRRQDTMSLTNSMRYLPTASLVILMLLSTVFLSTANQQALSDTTSSLTDASYSMTPSDTSSNSLVTPTSFR